MVDSLPPLESFGRRVERCSGDAFDLRGGGSPLQCFRQKLLQDRLPWPPTEPGGLFDSLLQLVRKTDRRHTHYRTMRRERRIGFATVVGQVPDTVRDCIIKRRKVFRWAVDKRCFTTYFFAGNTQPKYPASSLSPWSTNH